MSYRSKTGTSQVWTGTRPDHFGPVLGPKNLVNPVLVQTSFGPILDLPAWADRRATDIAEASEGMREVGDCDRQSVKTKK